MAIEFQKKHPDSYYNCFPEDYEGVTEAGRLDAGGSYEFDTFLVVEYDGHLHWLIDSGCSCPTPFEGVTGPADFEGHVDPNRVEPLVEAVSQWLGDARYGSPPTFSEARAFIAKMQARAMELAAKDER